ncbi:MAG: hypothetical protein M3043_12755 [Lysinibacillus fusiformis]|nr:hypothetical protein [Lysinibacillus fusiformis]MCT6817263.1 hypothetical protein [Lysinibacillus fusiformis]MCT6928314.1 hypothetical protein [Lysinibacillus fusiformis]MCT6933577.1 hypothetical protein [Lysinibacillus fusiformis]
MNPVYSCFLRNWENGRATEEQIDLAVTKELLTEEEAIQIKATEQNNENK